MAATASTLPQGQDTQQHNTPNPEGEDSVASATAASSLPTGASLDGDGKKRKLENGAFHSSQYSKIRSIVKDLRPFFLEVSQSPNFRGSKAAHEIQERMKTLMELTKQLRSETASITKRHDGTPAEELFPGSFEMEQAKEISEGGEQALQPQSEQKKDNLKELLNHGEEFSGPFLIGGSPIGWNFLVYPGHKPVFYGMSKESALARRADK